MGVHRAVAPRAVQAAHFFYTFFFPEKKNRTEKISSKCS